MTPSIVSASTRSSVFRSLLLVGLLSLIHCAYSAAQHRFYLRLTGQTFGALPLDIVIQTLISLLLVCYSAAQVAGDFRPIRIDQQVGICVNDYL